MNWFNILKNEWEESKGSYGRINRDFGINGLRFRIVPLDQVIKVQWWGNSSMWINFKKEADIIKQMNTIILDMKTGKYNHYLDIINTYKNAGESDYTPQGITSEGIVQIYYGYMKRNLSMFVELILRHNLKWEIIGPPPLDFFDDEFKIPETMQHLMEGTLPNMDELI